MTDEFSDWYHRLRLRDVNYVNGAVERLEELGPGLGRPWADTVKQSRHHHMKELRVLPTDIRILFAFDPRRSAVLLIGGDKGGQWARWYDEMVPHADDLYDGYLAELRREGLLE